MAWAMRDACNNSNQAWPDPRSVCDGSTLHVCIPIHAPISCGCSPLVAAVAVVTAVAAPLRIAAAVAAAMAGLAATATVAATVSCSSLGYARGGAVPLLHQANTPAGV